MKWLWGNGSKCQREGCACHLGSGNYPDSCHVIVDPVQQRLDVEYEQGVIIAKATQASHILPRVFLGLFMMGPVRARFLRKYNCFVGGSTSERTRTSLEPCGGFFPLWACWGDPSKITHLAHGKSHYQTYGKAHVEPYERAIPNKI